MDEFYFLEPRAAGSLGLIHLGTCRVGSLYCVVPDLVLALAPAV